MVSLSISRAWDETRSLVARDGRLFAAVALAMVGFPALILGFIDPRPPGEMDAPLWFDLANIVGGLVSLVGQLAIVRLALAPSTSVAGAIQHGAARLPGTLLAMLVLGLGLVIVMLPLVVAAVAMGFNPAVGAASMTPGIALLVTVLVLVIIALAVRFMLVVPVASAEGGGPVALLKRSWQLSSGVWWRLVGFIVGVLIVAVVLFSAIGLVIGALVALVGVPRDPMTIGALVGAIAQALVTVLFAVLTTVMSTRIYAQLSGRDSISGN